GVMCVCCIVFFFSSRRRHTRSKRDWSSDVCSSDLSSPVSLLEVRGQDHGSSRSVPVSRGQCATSRTGPDGRARHRGTGYSAPRCLVKRDSRGGDGPTRRGELLLRRGGELLRGDV